MSAVAGRVSWTLSLLFLAQLASAQAPAGATVSGVVWDSLAHAPLAGAHVQLVTADSVAAFSRTTIADSLGRFAFIDIPVGRYLVGFFHPVLDSLGIEPPAREVRVLGQQPVRIDLGIPSAHRLQAAFCPTRTRGDTGAVVIGVVRDATSRAPVAAAKVSASWLDLSITKGAINSQTQRIAATTTKSGWFTLCNAPPGGTVFLYAERSAARTDTIEMVVPANGVLRRELYIAPPAALGRLSGTVGTADDGSPVAGAEVAIVGGPRTRANDRGEWVLTEAPEGTRMLEIRAVGYSPDRTPVDVVDGGPPLRIALATPSAVLDTVNVKAAHSAQRETGFEQRRKEGRGIYITSDDVARRNPVVTSDMLRVTPGVLLDQLRPDSAGVQSSSFIRGAVGDWCRPDFYINGMFMPGVGASELDSWADPDEIVGIEVYSGAKTPHQFQRPRTGCGSIVVWTKPKKYGRHPAGLMIAASLGVAAGLGVLFERFVRH